MRYSEAIAKAGISPRQGDFWRGRYIVATKDGSGSWSEISPTEAAVLARMATLVRAGFQPQAAARVARAGGRVVDLDGVRVVFDVASREAG